MDPGERERAVRAMNDLGEHFPPEKLTMVITEVMRDMVDSGVLPHVAQSEQAVGCISQGVDDVLRGLPYSQRYRDAVIHLSGYDEREVQCGTV